MVAADVASRSACLTDGIAVGGLIRCWLPTATDIEIVLDGNAETRQNGISRATHDERHTGLWDVSQSPALSTRALLSIRSTVSESGMTSLHRIPIFLAVTAPRR